MKVESATEKKLNACIYQVEQLLLSDFPHSSSRSALEQFQTLFAEQLKRVKRASKSNDSYLIARACITANERIYEYLPILGFLIRSTDVRNSFEVYDALLDVSKSLIGDDAELVLSSEWDFSPLTYPLGVSALQNYVLVGLPSTESSNALILPLAGHELGHTVWITEDLENDFSADVEERAYKYLSDNWSTVITAFPEYKTKSSDVAALKSDMFVSINIAAIVELTISQVEEIFCDAVGQALFGRSYALAFHYLLAPSLGGERSLLYPSLNNRALFLSRFGGCDLVAVGFSDFASEFTDTQPSLPPKKRLTSRAADSIAVDLASAIFERATKIVQQKAIRHLPNALHGNHVYESFKAGVPASKPNTLSEILNAGWDFVIDTEMSFDEANRPLLDWASELILKSIEVLEFKRRTSHVGLSNPSKPVKGRSKRRVKRPSLGAGT